jgi:hypothetical protein
MTTFFLILFFAFAYVRGAAGFLAQCEKREGDWLMALAWPYALFEALGMWAARNRHPHEAQAEKDKAA